MRSLLSGRVIAFLAVTLLALTAAAQEKPRYDMGKMQMVFLRRAPEWRPTSGSQAERISREQREYSKKLIETGRCALAGTVKGDGDLREILVFKTESLEEIEALTKSFPAVQAGMLKAEVLSWYAARNFIKTAQTPLSSSDYIFGLLVRGPQWTATQTDETQKIQEGHMANINRLAGMGKLVLAGPFYEGGERRGVFIFKVGTIDEAQALTDTDPAVIAGRLKIELYRWSVPKGILP
jgi:uncharacterized protein YciI